MESVIILCKLERTLDCLVISDFTDYLYPYEFFMIHNGTWQTKEQLFAQIS